MAITTDSYYDIVYDEETLDRIGLSKTLDNYTIEEIADYAFVGSYSYYGRQISEKSLPDYTYVGYSTLHGSCPFAATFNAPNYDQIICDNGGTTHYNLTDNGIYRAVVLMHRTNNDPYPYQLSESDLEYMQIITEMDAPKYTVDFGATEDMEFADTPYWRPHDFTSKYNTHLGAVDNAEIATCGFEPYIVLQFQEHYFFINANTIWTGEFSDAPSFAATYINNSNRSVCANQLYDYTATYNAAISEAVDQWYQSYDFTDPVDTPFIKTVNLVSSEEYWCQYDGYASRIGFQISAEDGFSQYFCFTDEDKLLLYIAGICGLHFIVDDTIYKPIISDNFVVSYSDDLTVVSDLDNYVGSTKHVLPVTPPGPVPPVPPSSDDDNDDPISTTGAPFSAGLCHYYALTAGSVLLEHISEALGTWDIENTHKDLYKNLVSCKLIKPPAAIPTTGSEPFTIYGVKPQYNGADITLPVVTGNPDASFGPYTIDRKFGDFRDYAPYTRVSIYLPYCGWCDLPSHVVGKQIIVKYFTDIIAATCKAVVFCLSGTGSNIIAEAAGVIGLDIPFVADNVGAKMQAVTAGMISALGGGIQLGAGIGTMVSTKSGSGAKAALSGASQYLSGYSQMAMAFNENTTEISGKNGDGCCLAGATNIIIKIVRPKKGAYTTAPYVPPGYAHNIGFVSQKQVKVSSVSGLLIADNVDTSGISGATEAERAEIKRVLETGLIVNAAPE